ncbi:MAG: UDP-N-acetylmuramate--alanine ligase [Ferruginibacter sp.]|nr:UDP-N-acetylmuramate--alanine ligase [Ferruginibacter sp.]
MTHSISDFRNVFFIGVAGTGMSAIAQYLKGIGKNVSGSDRYFLPDQYNETRDKLEAEGIKCFEQDGLGIHPDTDLVVVSTAIEDTVFEVQKAKSLSIPILKRSELLAIIACSKKTIAVGGTSGKSTTSAMLFDIMEEAGMSPSIISGAGLTRLIKEGKIGNAKVGNGDWLIIEADESDGSIVNYTPEIGVLLNVDKDHQEIDELMEIFSVFKKNTKDIFIVNQSNPLSRTLSSGLQFDFTSHSEIESGFKGVNFHQEGLKVSFTINDYPYVVHTVGKHNMENALAAVAVAYQIGVSHEVASKALSKYEGIYRRHQILGSKNGVCVIDDYAHNPVKCASSIEACQHIAPKVIAWFQPHGYGPTRFLKDDFVKEFVNVLRPEDEIWMSEIFYAGGTAEKNISSADLINEIKSQGKNAFFIENRESLLVNIRSHLNNDCVLLLMGARDPSLEKFSLSVWENL